MLPRVIGEFRAATDPTLRFTPSGMAVAEFRAVADKKKKDDSTGEWVDDKVCWLTITSFKKLAENVAESVTKGSLVNIEGTLQTEDWETKEGEKRQTYRVLANTVGVSIAFNPAKSMSGDRAAGGGVSRTTATPDDDPFATPAPAGQSDEPPF